ncbi:MAG: glycoside hydrolase family 16 protein [Bacteroidaceae bacterium]|nr:glycoside hydrolase family 16 protein [Bacteroidaceae bacterium]
MMKRHHFLLMFALLLMGAQSLCGEEHEARWVQRIRVTEPAPCSDLKGRTVVQLQAPGLTHLSARCYVVDDLAQGRRARGMGGHRAAAVQLLPKRFRLDAAGRGHFVLDARKLPHGPLTVQIEGTTDAGERDLYELQLYNTSGRRTQVGIPDTVPAAAQGMRLAFSDDFDAPLSVSRDGRGTRYNAHKPTFGDFSGWPFTDPEGALNPFAQRDTYLIIRARKPEGTRGSTGLLATVDMGGQGYRARPPFYMECRLMAQSAPGTWPAFWTVTNIHQGIGDELDVIEAYGGWGKGNPNSTGYWTTAHFWAQNDASGKPLPHPGQLIETTDKGMRTSWSQTFHTYGLRVDRQWTTYYLDDVEVWRHPTNSVSMEHSHVVLLNYAIGGASGWPVDLDRYGNASDMYVDYLRVFEGE